LALVAGQTQVGVMRPEAGNWSILTHNRERGSVTALSWSPGMSIRAISRLTGYDRKTIRKYLIQPDGVPVFGPRAKQPGKLDRFKPYLEERMRAGVWNARVLLRELRERGYSGRVHDWPLGHTGCDADAT
jgi:transposase